MQMLRARRTRMMTIMRKTMMMRMSSVMLRLRRLPPTVEMNSGGSMGLGSWRISDLGMRSPRRVVRVTAIRMMLKVEVGRVTRSQAIARNVRMRRMWRVPKVQLKSGVRMRAMRVMGVRVMRVRMRKKKAMRRIAMAWL